MRQISLNKLNSQISDSSPVTASNGPRQDRLSQAIDEFYAAVDAGRAPDRERLLEKYLDIADELEDCLHNLDFIQRVTPQLSAIVNDQACDDSAKATDRAHLGDFRIIRELGRGGMGVVYEAEQISLGRRVALKVLPFAAMLDKQQLARFKNEARAAATLDHPNIVAIHSVGSERGVHYYAMQLIEGPSLAEIIAQLKPGRPPSPEDAATADLIKNPTADDTVKAALPTVRAKDSAVFSKIPPCESREYYRTVARLGIQAAEALDHAHQNGILHRDIKPANLLLDDTGKLWITDFGLARIEQDAGMTMTGDLLGTLRYMSPEQALAKRVVVDHRSDIYSLGLTLYEQLTLKPAFAAEDRQELLRQIAFDEPRKPRKINSGIPTDLETVVLKAIEKNPEDRYPDAQAVCADLRAFINNLPIAARTSSLTRVRKWSRRHRNLVITSSLTLVLCVIAVAGTFGWMMRGQATKHALAEATASQAIDDAIRLIGESKWEEAAGAVTKAEEVLTLDGNSGICRDHTRQLHRDLQTVRRLEEIRDDRITRWTSRAKITVDGDTEIRPNKNIDVDQYLKAFREYGIDLTSRSTDEAAQVIRQRSIRLDLVYAIDGWSRYKAKTGPNWKKLSAIARAADSDPIRNKLRDLLPLPKAKRKNALVDFARTIEPNDLDWRTVLLFGEMLAADGAWKEAAEILRPYHQRHPDNYYISFHLAQVTWKADPSNADAIIRYYTAALAVRPNDALVHIDLSVQLTNKGLKDEAILHDEEAVRLEPWNPLAQSNLSADYGDLLKIDLAIKHAKAAIDAAPDYAPAYHVLGRALMLNRDFDGAIANYQKALQISPKFKDVYVDMGIAKFRRGLLDDALSCLEQALRLKPNCEVAHANMSNCLLAKGMTEQALQHARQSIQINPKFAPGHCELARVLIRLDRLDEALAELQEALRIEPEFGDARALVGLVMLRTGHSKEALDIYKEVAKKIRKNQYDPDALECCDEALASLNAIKADAQIEPIVKEITSLMTQERSRIESIKPISDTTR